MAFWEALQSSALVAKGKGHWGESHLASIASKQSGLPSEAGFATHLRIPLAEDTKHAYIRHVKAEDSSKDIVVYEDCQVYRHHVQYDDCAVWEDRVVYQRKDGLGGSFTSPLHYSSVDRPFQANAPQPVLVSESELKLPFVTIQSQKFVVHSERCGCDT